MSNSLLHLEVSFDLIFPSQITWSLSNGTWQKRRGELDHWLSFEIGKMTLQMQWAAPVLQCVGRIEINGVSPRHSHLSRVKHIETDEDVVCLLHIIHLCWVKHRIRLGCGVCSTHPHPHLCRMKHRNWLGCGVSPTHLNECRVKHRNRLGCGVSPKHPHPHLCRVKRRNQWCVSYTSSSV